MHYHLEIIMPPTDDVDAAVKTILEPFNEQADEEGRSRGAFYDWYQIGGRWTGYHDGYEPDKDPANFELCDICNGTGFRSDALGQQARRTAPSYTCNACGERKEDGTYTHGEQGPGKRLKWATQWKNHAGDISTLGNLKDDASCYRVIIAGNGHGRLEATYMLEQRVWNGVTYHNTKWDGNLKYALSAFGEHLKTYRKEFADKITPNSDWLVVTVDYHC